MRKSQKSRSSTDAPRLVQTKLTREETWRQHGEIEELYKKPHIASRRRSNRCDYGIGVRLDPAYWPRDGKGIPGIVPRDALQFFNMRLEPVRQYMAATLQLCQMYLVDPPPTDFNAQQKFCIEANDPNESCDILMHPHYRNQHIHNMRTKKGCSLVSMWPGHFRVVTRRDGSMTAYVGECPSSGRTLLAYRFNAKEAACVEQLVPDGTYVEADEDLFMVTENSYVGAATGDGVEPSRIGPPRYMFDRGVRMLEKFAKPCGLRGLRDIFPTLMVEHDCPPVNGDDYRDYLLPALGPSSNWCLTSRYSGRVVGSRPCPGAPHLLDIIIEGKNGVLQYQAIPETGTMIAEVNAIIEEGDPLANPAPRLHYAKWADLDAVLPETMADWILQQFAADHRIVSGEILSDDADDYWSGQDLWPVAAIDTASNGGLDLDTSSLYWDIRAMTALFDNTLPADGFYPLAAVRGPGPFELNHSLFLCFKHAAALSGEGDEAEWVAQEGGSGGGGHQPQFASAEAT